MIPTSTQPIVVLGGGIGGLSAAHKLSHAFPGQEIHIYERWELVGGLARTSRDDKGRMQEICWKVISNTYVEMVELLKEIPDGEGRTVFDNLVPSWCVEVLGNEVTEYDTHPLWDTLESSPLLWLKNIRSFFKRVCGSFRIRDAVRLFNIVRKVKKMDDMQFAKEMDERAWGDLMKNIDPKCRRYVVDVIAVYVGMDHRKCSAHTILNMFRRNAERFSDHSLWEFNKPSGEAWFGPWVQHLESRGVKIFTNHSVEGLNTDDNAVTEVVVTDHSSAKGTKKIITPLYVVSAVSFDQLHRIYPASGPMASSYRKLSRFGALEQFQVIFYPPTPRKGPSIYNLANSPWFLVTRSEGAVHNEDHEVICAGICVLDRIGFNGKLPRQCTREEIAREVWMQLVRCGMPLERDMDMPEYDIWGSIQFNEETQKLENREPKFSNNVGLFQHRPSTKDSTYHNLRYGAAYTRTYVNIESQYSAVVAGIQAAQSIIQERTLSME